MADEATLRITIKTDDEVSSADQDAWVEIARSVRSQIEKLVPQMGAMKPEEVKTFIDALNQARWMNEAALAFDKTVENENAKLPYGN